MTTATATARALDIVKGVTLENAAALERRRLLRHHEAPDDVSPMPCAGYQRQAGSPDRRLLVGIDASEGAQRALRVAADIALYRGWRITLAYVVPASIPMPCENYGTHAPPIDAARRAQAEAVFRRAIEQLEEPRVLIDTVLLQGEPAQALAEAAIAADVALVIVGTAPGCAPREVGVRENSDRVFGLCKKPTLDVH